MNLEDFPRRDYVLHISVSYVNHLELRGQLTSVQNRFVTKEDGSRRVWRRFRVSGGLTLTVLADKVIDPLMGWYVTEESWYATTTNTWHPGAAVITFIHLPISMMVLFLDRRSDLPSSRCI